MSEIEANEVRFKEFLRLSDSSNLSLDRDFTQRAMLSAIAEHLSGAVIAYAKKPDKDYKRLFTGKLLSWELVIKGHE